MCGKGVQGTDVFSLFAIYHGTMCHVDGAVTRFTRTQDTEMNEGQLHTRGGI